MGARCTSTTTRRTMPTAAAQRTIRWVSHDRPGYGGSTPQPGRDVASAAAGVAGMAAAGAAELRAATAGRETLTELLASSEFDPEQFTPADHAMFDGPWSWLGIVAGQALQGGLGGMVDDDLAYVAPWGFDPGRVSAPVLLVHGGADRIRTQLAHPVARGTLPLGTGVAAPGRRTHLRAQLGHRGPGMARGPGRGGLIPR